MTRVTALFYLNPGSEARVPLRSLTYIRARVRIRRKVERGTISLFVRQQDRM